MSAVVLGSLILIITAAKRCKNIKTLSTHILSREINVLGIYITSQKDSWSFGNFLYYFQNIMFPNFSYYCLDLYLNNYAVSFLL